MQKIFRTIVATIFMIAMVITAFIFVNEGTIGQWTFCFILTFSLGAFAFISSIGDVLVLRFWNLELKFREIERAETSIKKFASAFLELAESDEGGRKLESWDRDRYESAKESIRTLIR